MAIATKLLIREKARVYKLLVQLLHASPHRKYGNINITTNNKLKSVHVNSFNDFTTSSVQMGCSLD